MSSTLPPLRLPTTLTDGVVLLDAYRLGDAQAHLAAEDEEMRRRFDATAPASLDQTRAAIARWIEARAAGGPMFVYAVRRTSGELVGGCELRMLSPHSAGVSWWTLAPFRRLGYAARAVSLLCQAASAVEGLERIEAHVAPDNLASRRLAETAGFAPAGTIEETAPTGAGTPMIRYARALAPGRSGR